MCVWVFLLLLFYLVRSILCSGIMDEMCFVESRSNHRVASERSEANVVEKHFAVSERLQSERNVCSETLTSALVSHSCSWISAIFLYISIMNVGLWPWRSSRQVPHFSFVNEYFQVWSQQRAIHSVFSSIHLTMEEKEDSVGAAWDLAELTCAASGTSVWVFSFWL